MVYIGQRKIAVTGQVEGPAKTVRLVETVKLQFGINLSRQRGWGWGTRRRVLGSLCTLRRSFQCFTRRRGVHGTSKRLMGLLVSNGREQNGVGGRVEPMLRRSYREM